MKTQPPVLHYFTDQLLKYTSCKKWSLQRKASKGLNALELYPFAALPSSLLEDML